MTTRKLASSVIVLFLCFSQFFVGCGGLLDSLKEESDAVDREAQKEEQFYKGANDHNSPRGRSLSANSVTEYSTESRRRNTKINDEFDGVSDEDSENMARSGLPKRRYSRVDFVDNGNAENSLWNGQGQTNYYFSHNNRFEQGDFVIVTVDRSLRREIQYALWKSLPNEERRIRKKQKNGEDEGKGNSAAGAAGTKSSKGGAVAAAKPNSKEADSEEKAAEDAAKSSIGAEKDNDLVRMEIIENMGNGLVRLQGQKRVIYRGRPKFVEVSALLRGRDIDDQAKTNSQTFLDVRTRVVQ